MRRWNRRLLLGSLMGVLGCEADPETDEAVEGEPPASSYQTFLREWYADYDAEQGVDYLDAEDVWDTLTIGGTAYDVLQDAAYGPHGERTSLDVYLPDGTGGEVPLVVFIHGGGFRAKGKEDLFSGARAQVMEEFLRRGVAVASINYRFRRQGGTETEVDANWDCKGTLADNDGCRLDVIYRDGARAVQYLRYRSDDLGIDPSRIGAWGRSAGGQIVTWIGVTPDLAVADHPDPVLRESTQLQAVGHTHSQATGPSHLWPELVTLHEDTPDCDQLSVWERLGEEGNTEGYNGTLQAWIEDLKSTEHGQDLMRVVDFLEAMDATVPPFLTTSPGDDASCEQLLALSNEEVQGKVLHHPRHTEPLYERCVEMRGPETCFAVTAVRDTFSDPTSELTSDPSWRRDENQVLLFMVEMLGV